MPEPHLTVCCGLASGMLKPSEIYTVHRHMPCMLAGPQAAGWPAATTMACDKVTPSCHQGVTPTSLHVHCTSTPCPADAAKTSCRHALPHTIVSRYCVTFTHHLHRHHHPHHQRRRPCCHTMVCLAKHCRGQLCRERQSRTGPTLAY